MRNNRSNSRKKKVLSIIGASIISLGALSSCQLLKALEKDVNVVFEIDGVYQKAVTVNMFNNGIAPYFDDNNTELVPKGYKFMGWSADHDWKFGDDRLHLISNNGIVRYDAVKNYVNKGGTAVAVPIIIDKDTIPRGDLVIAWYSNSNTSGIEEKHMKDFETKLKEYLVSEGHDVANMDIIIRDYGGNVGTSCGNIRKDDDVDIMLGWSNTSNLTGTGSMKKGEDLFANVGGISIGSKERYAALLSDDEHREFADKVYTWINSTYGNGSEIERFEKVEPDPIEPIEPEDPFVMDPHTSKRLTIGWYDNSNSGLTTTIMKQFRDGLEKMLEDNSLDPLSYNISIRPYSGKVGESAKQIETDGDCDILLGWGSNLESNLTNKLPQRIEGVTMGEKSGRYIDLYSSDNDLALAVMKFFETKQGKDLLVSKN